MATHSSDAFERSTFHENLVEHVFIAEVLQEAWLRFGAAVTVLRSEVDDSGYDVVLECGSVTRQVQLKATREEGRAQAQKVNRALEQRTSGCVVWLIRDDDRENARVRLRYRFFGGEPGAPLPSLDGFKPARHTKGNAQGVKGVRPNVRVVPRREFRDLADTKALLVALFGDALRSGTGGRRPNPA
jgi:hypothetical protein